MFEIIFYVFSLVLFLARIFKSQEANYYWCFALFIAGAVVWFGFYFAAFGGQATTGTVHYPASNVIVGNIIVQFPAYNSSSITQAATMTVNSLQFIALVSVTTLWSLLMFILGIYEWIDVMHSGARMS